jgi:hypothetical protein
MVKSVFSDTCSSISNNSNNSTVAKGATCS